MKQKCDVFIINNVLFRQYLLYPSDLFPKKTRSPLPLFRKSADSGMISGRAHVGVTKVALYAFEHE